MAFLREKSRLVSLTAIPAARPTLLANAVIETPPLTTVDVIRPVSTMLVIVLSHFNLFGSLSRTSISSCKYASILSIFFKRGSCAAVGFKSGHILRFSLLYMLIYSIAGDRMSWG